MNILKYNGRIVTPIGRVFSANGKRLSEQTTSKGYVRVNMFPKSFRVHRLVAMLYVPNPNGYDEVNHKDGDKSNNRAENLEWCTHKQNMEHARDVIGWVPCQHGDLAKNVKLSNADVAYIRSCADKTKDLAVRYGVSFKTVWAIRNNKARIKG